MSKVFLSREFLRDRIIPFQMAVIRFNKNITMVLLHVAKYFETDSEGVVRARWLYIACGVAAVMFAFLRWLLLGPLRNIGSAVCTFTWIAIGVLPLSLYMPLRYVFTAVYAEVNLRYYEHRRA